MSTTLSSLTVEQLKEVAHRKFSSGADTQIAREVIASSAAEPPPCNGEVFHD